MLGLAMLWPLMLLIAIVVKAGDNGSIFYTQCRVGLNGKRFRIIKFRTMTLGAERDLGPIWSPPGDPRCTRAGAVLRRLGFDELPQLWNVLRGDMSLVGPRPERPSFIREFRTELPRYNDRHRVRCGLTGYAQIHGWRGYTDIGERLKHDLFYVKRWSLSLDMKILLLTLIRGWSERTRDGVTSRERLHGERVKTRTSNGVSIG